MGALVAAAAALAAACSSAPDPATLRANDSGGAVSLTDVPRNTPYSFSMFSLCVHGHGTPMVTDVTLNRPSGAIELLGWAMRKVGANNQALMLSGPQPLPSDLGWVRTGPVTVACSDTVHQVVLDVSIADTGITPARTWGVWVHYTSDGHSYQVLDPLVLTLCPARCSHRDGHPFPQPGFDPAATAPPS